MGPGAHDDHNFFDSEFLKMKEEKKWRLRKTDSRKREICSGKGILKNIGERDVFEEIKKYYEANF